MTASQREAAVHSLAVLLGAWLSGRTRTSPEMRSLAEEMVLIEPGH